ncbi:Eco57I restriction-modification methylase domain-containing protein [Empedobacter sp.]|uniref:Eco57I restriction-modification methylase domain-containing protein n=1 Tax=Empedobacter sp. TaxID=1927715 RepID=UPI0028A9F247|nr:TaqI-like C-terminal specificity domain-containing protein [Empedobacter sp.]
MDVKNLQHKLNQPYNIDNWKEIVQFVFPNVSLLESPIEIYTESQKITKFIQFGNVRLSDGKVLALFEIKLADGVNLQRNRVELNNEVSKHIDQEQIHGVLSVFDQDKDDYRFTFSARSSEFDEEEGDFIAIKTDTKRYTYVLGKNESCKTPAKRFFELSQNKENAEIGDLQKAFSVEKLSKEFFDKYKFQFEKFWNYINSHEEYRKLFLDNDKDKQIRDFTKKLLGRVVFLHFLQKKGWMGCDIDSANWENGEKQFMQKLFDGFSDKTHFHSKCLHQLFFNTLNNNKRENFIFQCEGVSDELNNTKIPYLNGGLFDADKDISEQIDFPEGYFIDLLDLFSQYNFTIDENDPNDHEVGIDPEMLGHIFENLLEDNKDKGAFYTPKVIVQYMCQESLIEYLATKLNASPDTELKIAIVDLVRNRLAQGINDLDKVEAIAQALHIVKICDPAIGSGAFPMGILNEIFKIVDDLYHLQPDAVAPIWNINSEIWEPSVIKKSIIQKSIYGVDLESGAVDIARLRFWLALIVDESEPLPLPNLDYKIMQGNSLLESYEGIDLSKIADAKAYEEFMEDVQIDMFTGEAKKKIKTSLKVEDIQQLIQEYFSTSDPENKKDLHDRIDEQVFNHIKYQINKFKKSLKKNIDVLEAKLERDVNASRTEEQKKKILTNSKTAKDLVKNKTKLSEYVDKDADLSRIIKSNDKPFFLWNLYFKDVFDQGGFDIVIGNPPYGVSIKGSYRDYVLEKFGKVPDFEIYYFFTELAYRLIKEKGIKSYIIPNTFLFNTFAEKYRLDLVEKWNLIEILDCTKFSIFQTATVRNAITLWKKTKGEVVGYRQTKNKKTFTELINSKRVKINIDELLDINQNWGLAFYLDDSTIERISKIKMNKTYLSNLFPEISQGLIAYDKYKGQTEDIIKNRAYHFTNFIKPDLKKWLWGEDVTRYNIKWNGKEYIDYCDGVANPRNPKYFIGERLLIREITNPTIFAAITNEELYNDPSLLIVKSNDSYSVKPILAILNSKLASYFHFNHSPKATKGAFPKILIKDLNEFPIPLNFSELELLSVIIEYILTINQYLNFKIPESNIINDIEEIIDALVLELYFPKDFKDKNIKISKHTEDLFKPLEGLNDEEKLETIEEVYIKYRAKNNPLRNQIKLMKIELSELLLPILSI